MSRLQFKYDPTYTKLYVVIKKEAIAKEHFKNPKTEKTAEVKTVQETRGLTKQKPTKTITNITDEIVNTYIKENLETVTDYVFKK